MKFLFTFIICFSFCSLLGQNEPQPFKKANTILIQTGLPGKEAFTSWGKHLGQTGFSIDKSDGNFFTLTTGTKAPKKYNVEYYLICAVSDSGVIKIRAKWRVPPSSITDFKGTEFFDWEYSASRSNTTNSIY